VLVLEEGDQDDPRHRLRRTELDLFGSIVIEVLKQGKSCATKTPLR